MDNIPNNKTPQSIEAEKAVIGSMLIDGSNIGNVIGILKSKDFYSLINRDIFKTMLSMFNYAKPIDPLTILEELRKDGVSHDDLLIYIRDLIQITPTAANVNSYACIVREKSLLRGLIDIASDVNSMAIAGKNGAASIIEDAEQKLYDLRMSIHEESHKPFSASVADVYNQIIESAKSGRVKGLSIGFAELDKAIMGLYNTDFVLVTSIPGMGKTNFAVNIALNVAGESGKAVAMFSLDLTRDQLVLRLLSSVAQIDGKKLQTGRINEREKYNLERAAKQISDANIVIIDDASITIAEINAHCRRISDLGLVIIDSLQLLTENTIGNKDDDCIQTSTEISRTLKVMANALNVPIVCLSQLKCLHDKRPRLSDLHKYNAIMHDADIIMALYRDAYYDTETEFPNLAECIILNNRRGETGTVYLRYDAEYVSFSSIATNNNEY